MYALINSTLAALAALDLLIAFAALAESSLFGLNDVLIYVLSVCGPGVLP